MSRRHVTGFDVPLSHDHRHLRYLLGKRKLIVGDLQRQVIVLSVISLLQRVRIVENEHPAFRYDVIAPSFFFRSLMVYSPKDYCDFGGFDPLRVPKGHGRASGQGPIDSDRIASRTRTSVHIGSSSGLQPNSAPAA